MNKAIQYREDGKFYGLVNVPDEPTNMYMGDQYYGSMMDEYREKLEACIAAGKEIINPEIVVNGKHAFQNGYIFDCPDNIEFEEIKRPFEHLPLGFRQKLIRLKLKEEVKPFESQDELREMIAKVHDDIEGRYELDSYDKVTIHALLCKLQ